MRIVTGGYDETVDYLLGVEMRVRYRRAGPKVIGYSVILVLDVGGQLETIRAFDGAHGFNEMHRYTRSLGKQTGKPFHSGSLGEGMRAATNQVKSGYRQMIEGWER